MVDFVIDSQKARFDAVEAVKNIRKEPLMVVSIAEFSNDRTAAQNRLYWAWLTDISRTTINEHAGHTENDWHLRFKRESLLNIYIRDPNKKYAKLLGALYQIKQDFGHDAYELQYEYIIETLSTKEASVKQFTEYLRHIQHFCGYSGIFLRTDSADFKRAMGVK